ncbi:MAG: hypothetical protein AABY18_04220 [Candidatus Thermoplasmatota archaeon]
MSPEAENRIRLKVQQEATPISLQDQVDLKAQIKVDVETHLTGLGMGGVIALTLGALCLLVGCITLAATYPDNGWSGPAQPFSDSHYDLVRAVVLLIGVGVTLLMLGTAMFFYGRTVLGSGGLQQLESIESLGRQ